MSRDLGESGSLSPAGDSLAPFGLEDGLLGSPGSPLSSAIDPSSPLALPSMRPYSFTNAVHMEVQENAKLPTFNLPVDRSNSSSQNASSGYAPATARAIDEMIRLSENDFNLSEMFLKSEERSNANRAYSGTGRQHEGSNERRYSISEGSMTSADMIAPSLGERDHVPASPASLPLVANPLLSPVVGSDMGISESPGTPTAGSQSYYPYGRRFPLPIPTKLPSPVLEQSPATSPTRKRNGESDTSGDPLAVAIATAAAIVSQKGTDPSPSLGETESGNKKTSVGANGGNDQEALEKRNTNGSTNRQVLVSRVAQAVPLSSDVVNAAKKSTGATTTVQDSAGMPSIQSTTTSRAPLPGSLPNGREGGQNRRGIGMERSAPVPPTKTQQHKIVSAPATQAKPAIPPKGSSIAPTKPTPAPASTAPPYHQHSRPSPAAHAAAHATSSASIKEATKRRSQFGFGGNHVVPSVPLPPPKSRSKMSKKAARAKQSQQRQLSPSVSTGTNSEVAYERKKQRAKEARVKLNDSIEHMAMSINLAGTQSKSRAAQISSFDFAETGTKFQEFRRGTLQIMEECQITASSAKKWDRPSFVGTAASLIQELNTQCDSILRVLLEYRRQVEQQRLLGSGPSETVTIAPSVTSDSDTNPNALSVLQDSARLNSKLGKAIFGTQHHVISRDAGMEPLPPKRQKLEAEGISPGQPLMEHLRTYQVPVIVSDSSPPSESEILTQAAPLEQMLFDTPSVVTAIASFLEPRSLTRCTAVSKGWKSLCIFQSEDAWQRHCLQRFGLVAVRRWVEKEVEDDDDGSESMGNLYRRMDASNVRPQCRHEGNLLLGEAKIQGVASAWVSMVERSNCETARSVRKEGTGNKPDEMGQYTSLPVVELRVLIQNIGVSNGPIVLKEQVLTVDASTRRRGEEMSEIHWDDRFKKTVMNADGSARVKDGSGESSDAVGELCSLQLFESVVLIAYIHARGCSTTSKFQQRANFARIFISVNGTTVPLAIPFARIKVA